ncbi:MAG: BtaA family protein [Bacteroidales bacterium]|jgi:S-adenosylmethionine-diacylglycerol 3-amino-3-carboxypropyl transferase|nr:BtaA family protein [Bacteroidales bacterium]
MKHEKDQVKLLKLIFTLNWEDPEMDRMALGIKPGDTLMTITSGGCNTLGFLLQDPSEIHTVDINPSQSYVIELKIAAMKCLEYKEFIGFTGLCPIEDRLAIYNRFRNRLSNGAAAFWDNNAAVIKKGFLLNGRYETFVKLVSGFVRMIEGNRRVNDLFIERDPEDQKSFAHREWDTARTRFIFNAFFNKFILARRGLKADYFTFDDGSNTFAESFFRRFRKVIMDVPVKNNYFLHLYLKGYYRSLQEVPDYLMEGNFITIKSRLDRIKIVTMDAQNWLPQIPSDFIDCFALSNICELMSLDDTFKLFSEVIRTARNESRISFRNLIIPREVPESLHNIIVKDIELTNKIFNADRSFVYSKVAAYRVMK